MRANLILPIRELPSRQHNMAPLSICRIFALHLLTIHVPSRLPSGQRDLQKDCLEAPTRLLHSQNGSQYGQNVFRDFALQVVTIVRAIALALLGCHPSPHDACIYHFCT